MSMNLKVRQNMWYNGHKFWKINLYGTEYGFFKVGNQIVLEKL